MSAGKFNKDHIEGKAPRNKPINTQGNFDDESKRYLSVRPSGAPPGTRVLGTKPDQKKTVVENIAFTETRWGEPARDGVADFMVTGKKDKKSMKPEHLDGQVTKEEGKYKDYGGNEFSECSSSTSAYYSQ
ncbi:hypothetical protein E2C01_042730 [Portunus trituberculatus]|uniref:Uncharacterized protein n=1 Tax=Portunus trituberculatus TaxID=210409 RepID=A0A5B7FR00_PORTR|nr:hypothetical protein [Portunus trituberculatus]